MYPIDCLHRSPRVLLVFAECTLGPAHDVCNAFGTTNRRSGGSRALLGIVTGLQEAGFDVHCCFPDCRGLLRRSLTSGRPPVPPAGAWLPESHVHLAQDCAFFRADPLPGAAPGKNPRRALALQREALYHVIPRVWPDLVHCVGPMTGLLPAAVRNLGMASVFSLEGWETETCTLAAMEDCGIDPLPFWRDLYYTYFPGTYGQCRHANPADMLASGVLAAAQVHVFSTGFQETREADDGLSRLIADCSRQGRLAVTHGALGADLHPGRDPSLKRRYNAAEHDTGKKLNKIEVQRRFGLQENAWIPLAFCPIPPGMAEPVLQAVEAALDNAQAGSLQVVFQAASAEAERIAARLAPPAKARTRAVWREDRRILGPILAGADFFLCLSRPSPIDPLPAAAVRYGALPIVPRAGGGQDEVTALETGAGSGQGFVYRAQDAGDLSRALADALDFHSLPAAKRRQRVARVMEAGAVAASPGAVVGQLTRLYAAALGGRMAPAAASDRLLPAPPARMRIA